MRALLLAAILSLFLASAWAGDMETYRALATSLDQDNTYEVKPDPLYYGQRPTGYVRTGPCRHRAADEKVVIAASREPDRAWLVFGSQDICEIIQISMDRNGLAH